jgi:hypothetical protein
LVVVSVALVVSFLAAGAAVAASTRASAVDAKLVGQWTHTISKAAVQREEGFGTLAGEHCTLTVKTSGAAHVVCAGPARLNFSGPITSTGQNRIQIALGDTAPNAYRWHVASGLLTLTKLNDSNPDRAATMSGVWKRK